MDAVLTYPLRPARISSNRRTATQTSLNISCGSLHHNSGIIPNPRPPAPMAFIDLAQ